MSDVLLLAVVVVLVILLLKRNSKPAVVVKEVAAPPQQQTCGAEGFKAPEPEALKTPSYDEKIAGSLAGNSEYFSVGCSADNVSKVLDCVCEGDEPGAFAKFDYGAPNMSYKDFVASQAVDDQVIENHMQYVRDRRGLGPEGEFITGRTYSPDSHDSYDPIPWQGIRGRPQGVAQCNPTQVPDVDTNLFKGNRPYCLWT